MRTGPTNPNSLAPFEMHTVRVMRTPGDLCIGGGEFHVMGDRLVEYCRHLSQCVSQDCRTKPDLAEDKNGNLPGQRPRPGENISEEDIQCKQVWTPHHPAHNPISSLSNWNSSVDPHYPIEEIQGLDPSWGTIIPVCPSGSWEPCYYVSSCRHTSPQ